MCNIFVCLDIKVRNCKLVWSYVGLFFFFCECYMIMVRVEDILVVGI